MFSPKNITTVLQLHYHRNFIKTLRKTADAAELMWKLKNICENIYM